MFASGLAAAVNGFYRGRDEETRRQQIEDDREFQRGQRAHQVEQQRRQSAAWAREDQLREDLANIPTTTTKTTPGQLSEDAAGNVFTSDPTTREVAVPKDTQLRQVAQAYKRAGSMDAFFKSNAEADKIMFDRARQRTLQLEASSAGMSAEQIAEQARQIFDDDPFPFKVRSIRPDGAGGVSVDIEDGDSGTVTTHAYKNQTEILNGLKAIYAPEMWAAVQTKRAELAAQAQAKALEPQKVSPGQSLVVGGKVVYQAPPPAGFEYIGDDAQGNPQYRKAAAGTGGSSAGSGGSKKTADTTPLGQAREMLEGATKVKGAELDDAVYARAQTYLEQLYQEVPGAPPAAAADVARAVAKDPTLLKPQLNAVTGQFDGVFRDRTIAGGQPFTLARGYLDVKDIQERFPDNKTDLPNMVAEMVAAQVPPSRRVTGPDGQVQMVPVTAQEAEQIRNTYIRAAHNPRERAQLVDEIGKTAGPQAAAALQRKLDLIFQFMPDPDAPKRSGRSGNQAPLSPEQKAALRQFGRDPDAPTIGQRIATGARGLAGAVRRATAPGEAYVRSTLQKINATGQIEDGDAAALAEALELNPALKELFSKEQLIAIGAISRRPL